MKKLVILFAAAVFAAGLAGCGESKGVENTQASVAVTEEEKQTVDAVINEAVPSGTDGEYYLTGVVAEKNSDTLKLDTERGSELTFPADKFSGNISKDDNVLVKLKMDISKTKTIDDIEIADVTKL